MTSPFTPSTIPASGGSQLTTKGDLLTFDTALARLGVGANTHVLTADSAQSLGIKWAAAAGGLSQSYIGYNTAGGSTENMAQGRAYGKSVTLASAGLVTTIDAYVKGNGTNVGGFGALIFTDSGGAPTNIIHQTVMVQTVLYLNTTARWVSVPCGAYLAAGTYWIAVYAYTVVSGATILHYNGSGTDKYVDAANVWANDSSLGTPGTTTNQYSIRGSRLS